MIFTLFDTDDGTLATAASLTAAEAQRHAWNLQTEDLELLSDGALLAVSRVRALRCATFPPAPVMRRPDGLRAAWRGRRA